MEEKKLLFYGGEWISFLPILIFVILTVVSSFGLHVTGGGAGWLPAFIAVSIPMFLAKNKVQYANAVVRGLSDRNVAIPIICWIYAGVFARILGDCGLAESIAKLAVRMGMGKVAFLVITFLCMVLFAMAIGSGMGTVAMGMGVFYPAGVVMGVSPTVLAGSILSGAALGDFMSFVSDTTVCSCTVMEAPIDRCWRARWKYSLVSGGITLILIVVMGYRQSYGGERNVVITADDKALFMLIPMILTLGIAMKYGNIIVATTCGIVVSCGMAVGLGLIDFVHVGAANGGRAALIEITGEGTDRALTGILYEGIQSMMPNILLCLLLFGMIQIMKEGNGDQRLLNALARVVRGPVSAELIVSVMIIVLAALWGLNAPAILLIGASFGQELAKKQGIGPGRMANLMAAHSVTLCYCAPWTAVMMLAVALSASSPVPLSAARIAPHMYYAYISIAVMMITSFLHIGRKDGMSVQNKASADVSKEETV